ncbi:MAG: hypothetical protein J2P21_28340 [Chloracidobacterium sp.]|nr:hypothetical protein [Chloracidobacterium sp.]
MRSGIPLKAGNRVRGITVTIAESAASLRGRVLPDKGGLQLPAKMIVNLIPAETVAADDMLRYAEVVVDKGGAFVFKNMESGKYRLLARAEPDDKKSDKNHVPAAWMRMSAQS